MRTLLLFIAGYIFSAIVSCTNIEYTVKVDYCDGRPSEIITDSCYSCVPRIYNERRAVPEFSIGRVEKLNVCDFKIISKKELK